MTDTSMADLSVASSTANIIDTTSSDGSRSGSCRLACLQNVKVFTCALSILACINGGIAAAYLPGVITTIEERFALNSSTSGLIVGSYEIGAIIAVVLVSYMGHHGHIPLILGWGTFVIAIGAALFSVPHFLAEPYSVQLFELRSNISIENNTDYCNPNLPVNARPNECERETLSTNSLAIGIFISAQQLIGIGSAPILTIGLSYIDNFVRKKASAQYLAMVYAASIVGAVLGFGVGSGMLQVFVDTFTDYTPDLFELTPDDDLWLGAWWAGFLLFAVLMCIIAPWMCMFPKSMEIEKLPPDAEDIDRADVNAAAGLTSGKLSELPKSLFLLLKNPVYMLINLGSVCIMLIVTGYLTFAAKYLETQFYVDKSIASLLTGVVGVPGAVSGIVAMGYIMKKFKMGEMGAIKSILILNLISCAGFAVSFFLGCKNVDIAGVTSPYQSNETIQLGIINLTNACNSDCNCIESTYSPVCHVESGTTFVSHCHAGCDGPAEMHSCSCITSHLPAHSSTQIEDKSCKSDCKMLPVFLVVLFILSCAMAGIKTPVAVITLRRVSNELKSFSLGIQVMVIRLLALLPAPVVYGSIIDSSCMWWKTECGKKLNCLVYNNNDFIFRFQGLSLAFHLLGTLTFFIAYLIIRRSHVAELNKEDNVGHEYEATVTRL